MGDVFDFAAYAPDGRLVLLVEAKARRGTNDVWAADRRKGLLESAPFARDSRFLLATPQAVYLWDPGAEPVEFPTYSIAGDVVFKRYFDAAGITAEDFIEPAVFEQIVAQWLRGVTHGDGTGSKELDGWSGLAKLLTGGRVVERTAA